VGKDIGNNMNISIVLALIACILLGLEGFVRKVAGANQVYIPSYMMVNSLCFSLITILMHVVQKQPFVLAPRMAGLALLQSVVAATGVLAMLLAFRLGGQGSIIFPIIALGVVVSVPLSYIVFREPITTTKLLGLGFGVTSIIFLSR
jgi:uncharacterized membrane protein